MNVTMRSMITGKVHTRDIPVTMNELAHWKESGLTIQEALPMLSRDDREFLMTGITPEEWSKFMAVEEEK